MISFLSKILKFNTVNVVGVIKREEDVFYHMLTVKKAGSRISITARQTFDSFSDLKQKTDSKLPVILVLGGKGVLNKQIAYDNEADMNWLKNIDHSAIYFTSYATAAANFMCFCRKTYVEEVIAGFQQSSFQIIDVYVGSLIAALLQTSVHKNNIVAGDLSLEFKDDVLVNYSKFSGSESQKQHKIGNDTIDNSQLPLYASVVQFFIESDSVTKSQLETLNKEEIVYKKAFCYFGIATLAFFLLSLMVSFFLIQYYGSKTADLNLQSVYSSQAYKQIKELEKQKEKQLGILNESGLMSSKFLSYFSYELMKEMPASIRLNELNVVPVAEKEIKADKKINFEAKQILLKGESANGASINNWIEKLGTIKWIKKFEIVSLKRDKKNISRFEIKIIIADV